MHPRVSPKHTDGTRSPLGRPCSQCAWCAPAGPRICIGNHFSLLESHLLLAMLAQRFTPRLRAGFVPRWEMQGTLGIASGLPMVIEPR